MGSIGCSCAGVFKKQTPSMYIPFANDPKFLDRQVSAKSVEPDQLLVEEQSDLGQHCLPFRLHPVDISLW